MVTKTQADDLLEQIAEYNAQIKAAEVERDEFIRHYEMKIQRARELCADKCRPIQQEKAILEESIRRYAQDNFPEESKTITTRRFKVHFRKQLPKFYDGDNRELTGKNKALLELVKSTLPQYVKVTQEESVAWNLLKKNLAIDGDKVYFAETGELLEGLRGQILPDSFTIELK